MGQVGIDCRLNQDYSVAVFGRMLADQTGMTRMGAAVELARKLTEAFTLAIGYSTLDFDDPDLQELVDWPSALYLRLRLKF